MYYLYLQSSMHHGEILKKSAQDLFDAAEKLTGTVFQPGTAEQVADEAVSVVYIATGGTAGKLKEALPMLGDNIIIVTSRMQNSLSASMESATYIKGLGKNVKLIHGDSTEDTAEKLAEAVEAEKALRKLRGTHLGLIGKPSDWLISTAVDYAELERKTGISVEDISMDELLEEIAKGGYEENSCSCELLNKNFDKAQIEQALEIYGAFKRITDRHGLNGVSVRCFDLLSAVKNTGCIGLAILNACGIYGACESDLPSLISMTILGTASGEPVFMCNPSRINSKSGEITFAHCTLPLNMPERYSLDTHFESGIGVAVAGDIPLGPVTIFKASADLSHYFLSYGEITETPHDVNLCRSQIVLKCAADTNSFLHSYVGNHYLVCRGDHTGRIKLIMDSFGAEMVK